MNEDVNSVAADGVSRRSMLKKGALVGATVAWTVPLISVVSMTPAHAESPSGAGHGGGSGSGTDPAKQGSNNGGKSTNLGSVNASNTGALASTGSDVSATAAIGVAAAVLGAGAIVASKYRGDRTEGDAAAK